MDPSFCTADEKGQYAMQRPCCEQCILKFQNALTISFRVEILVSRSYSLDDWRTGCSMTRLLPPINFLIVKKEGLNNG